MEHKSCSQDLSLRDKTKAKLSSVRLLCNKYKYSYKCKALISPLEKKNLEVAPH